MKTSRTTLWLVGLVIGGGLILSRANFAQEDDPSVPFEQLLSRAESEAPLEVDRSFADDLFDEPATPVFWAIPPLPNTTALS